MDALLAQALDLCLTDVGDTIKVVVRFPLGSAALTPVAKTAGIALLGNGGRTLDEESVEALPQPPIIVRIVAHPEMPLGAIAEHQMHVLRADALERCQEFGVMGELDHEFRLGTVGKLGVYYFVAPATQSRRRIDPAQKIGIAHEGTVRKGCLENDLGAFGHCKLRGGEIPGETPGAGKFHQVPAACAQRIEVTRLMGETFVLKQFHLLIWGSPLQRRIHVDEVQCQAMRTFEKANQIRCGTANGIFMFTH